MGDRWQPTRNPDWRDPDWRGVPPSPDRSMDGPMAGPGPDLRTYAWIVHGLYAVGLMTGITAVPGVILAYLKRGEAAGPPYESHFAYAIRSFWIGLLLTLVGIALSFVLVGLLVLALVWVWWLVRIIRPIVALMDDRPIADPTGFL